MLPRKHTLRATHEHEGVRLDQFLATELPKFTGVELSKAKVRKLIVAGAVYLNASRVRIASKLLRVGAKVDVYLDLEKLSGQDSTQKDIAFVMTAAQVLFEDEFLIAVDKPPGIPTQPTVDDARLNLVAAVKTFLKSRGDSVDPYLGLHHRLDRDTSGVILFTKSKQANAGVGDLFSKHLAQKTYQAITAVGPLVHERWRVDNFLGRLPGSGKKSRFGAVRSGGDRAITDFKLLTRASGGLLIEARPKTGRTHQIRVHLSESGLPILGDPTYGGAVAAKLASRTMLHAAELSFIHPITRSEMLVQSPKPADFEKCLLQIAR